ncbi:hypothetical protein V1478_002994 [Vespula squamosa]|uniref:Uncharacterized protein n=1 Tax=Vespula squamosa TaxID=30214 RepID=A0ABD2BRE3_VESSQ
MKVFKRFDACACPVQSYCARANCTSPMVLSLSRLQCPWGGITMPFLFPSRANFMVYYKFLTRNATNIVMYLKTYAIIMYIQEQIEKHASAVHRLGDLPLKDKSRSKYRWQLDSAGKGAVTFLKRPIEGKYTRKLEDDGEATAVIGYTEVDEGGKEECIGIRFTSTKPTHTSQRIVQPRRIGLSDGTISYLGIEIRFKIRLNIAKTNNGDWQSGGSTENKVKTRLNVTDVTGVGGPCR